jgi:hypothetical protein
MTRIIQATWNFVTNGRDPSGSHRLQQRFTPREAVKFNERPEGCFAFSVPDPLFQRTTEPELLAVTKHYTALSLHCLLHSPPEIWHCSRTPPQQDGNARSVPVRDTRTLRGMTGNDAQRCNRITY